MNYAHSTGETQQREKHNNLWRINEIQTTLNTSSYMFIKEQKCPNLTCDNKNNILVPTRICRDIGI